uniref:F-box domain-containing protein n=1 Tax=Meloidogyne incognita TaxID=6306 RepID=A0A914MU06_MELIC
MTQRGQMLQAIGEDGIVYTWYRRPYNRRVPTQRQLELQQQLQPIQGEPRPTPQMLNPKQTQLSELGELILIRCFQSLPINDRFNMELVSRLFQSASKRSWNIQKHVVVVPDVVLDEEYNYSVDGRYLFRLLMKRCARYALELTIHAMLKQDRIFRLLHLGYRVEHLCIDSLHSICGSELKEIGERLPNLKSLIIKRSTFHLSTIKCFNLMLEQLEQLQILSISNCNNFKCQLEQLPNSLRIFFLDDFQRGNVQNVLRNIHLRAPNITVLSVENIGDLKEQVQAFEHLKVLCLPYEHFTADDVNGFTPNFLQRLTAFDMGIVRDEFALLRFVPEMFPQLEHLTLKSMEFLDFKLHKYLDPIALFPALRSFTLKVYARTKLPVNQTDYLKFLSKLIRKGKLEYLLINFPLSTELAIDVIKYCPNIKTLFFTNEIVNDEKYFKIEEFIEEFKKLKENIRPPINDENKIKMHWSLFENTEFEDGNEWIMTDYFTTKNQILKQLISQEIGGNVPIQLFDDVTS